MRRLREALRGANRSGTVPRATAWHGVASRGSRGEPERAQRGQYGPPLSRSR